MFDDIKRANLKIFKFQAVDSRFSFASRKSMVRYTMMIADFKLQTAVTIRKVERQP